MSDDANKQSDAEKAGEKPVDLARIGKAALGAALLAADKVRDTIAKRGEGSEESSTGAPRANDIRPRKRRMKRKRNRRGTPEEALEKRRDSRTV